MPTGQAPRTKPGPLQYIGYCYGKRLPDSMRDWVANDLAGPGATIRMMVRVAISTANAATKPNLSRRSGRRLIEQRCPHPHHVGRCGSGLACSGGLVLTTKRWTTCTDT